MKRQMLWIACLGMLMARPAAAESVRSLIGRGNTAYAAGKFDEALKLYQEAEAKDPKSPEIQYNLGNARYKLNDLSGAAANYQQAASATTDPGIVSRSKFNLGNTAFRQGEQAEAQTPEQAVAAFQESVADYRAALELNSGFKAAGRNLEVSKRRLQRVQEAFQQRQQAKEEQQRQEQQKADHLKQMAKQQQEMAQASRDQAGQESADNKAMADQAAAQKELRDKTEALRQQMDQPGAQQQAKDSLQQAEDKQQEAQEKLQQGNPGEAAKSQEQAAQSMQEAADTLQGKDKKEPPKAGQGNTKKDEKPAAQGGKPDKDKAGGQPSKPEKDNAQQPAGRPAEALPEGKPSDQTAQDLLNEEKQNTIKRRQEQTSGYEAVDKDW